MEKRNDPASMIRPGGEVWIRLYDSEGNEVFPEARALRVPIDFALRKRIDAGIKVRRFVRSLALWDSPVAGTGVNVRAANSCDGFICSTELYPGHPDPGPSAPVECRIDVIMFDVPEW